MVEIDDKETKRAPLKRSASSFTKQKKIQRELDVPHEAPENWETVGGYCIILRCNNSYIGIRSHQGNEIHTISTSRHTRL